MVLCVCVCCLKAQLLLQEKKKASQSRNCSEWKGEIKVTPPFFRGNTFVQKAWMKTSFTPEMRAQRELQRSRHTQIHAKTDYDVDELKSNWRLRTNLCGAAISPSYCSFINSSYSLDVLFFAIIRECLDQQPIEGLCMIGCRIQQGNTHWENMRSNVF